MPDTAVELPFIMTQKLFIDLVVAGIYSFIMGMQFSSRGVKNRSVFKGLKQVFLSETCGLITLSFHIQKPSVKTTNDLKSIF